MAEPTSNPETAPRRGLDLGPRSMERSADQGSTLVGGLETATPARVDGGGLVHVPGSGWSIDWWIGGDDRWYLPAREPSVRQRRIGYGPVVETSVRIPSGDAVHTTYPVVAAGGTLTVIEIENRSPVPVALAIAVRPYGIDGRIGSTGPSIELGDEVIEVDGRPALLLPRAPSSFGRSDRADLLALVEAGGDPTDDTAPADADGADPDGSDPDGSGRRPGSPVANAVALYPLPHKTSLRFAIPEPSIAGGGAVRSLRVGALPDGDSSARGWTTIVERGSRFEFPDSGVTEQVGAARSRLLLAAPTLPRLLADLDPASAPILIGLGAGGHEAEVRTALDELARSFPTSLEHGPEAGAAVIEAVADAVGMLDEAAPGSELLESLAQLTHLVERSDDVEAAAAARAGLARLLRTVGQPDAADRIESDEGKGRRRWFRRPTADGPTQGTAADSAPADAEPAARLDDPDLAMLTELVERSAPARRWGDDDPVPAAEFWLMAREFLVRTDPARPGRVELLAGFPTAWRGGEVEIHRAPTPHGRVSFAVRWHGFRPALLWEIEPRPGSSESVHLVCPALDPDWSTTETKGETLLAGLGEELPPAPEPGDSFS